MKNSGVNGALYREYLEEISEPIPVCTFLVLKFNYMGANLCKSIYCVSPHMAQIIRKWKNTYFRLNF